MENPDVSLYRKEFKYYKSKCPPPDYSKVVDFSKFDVRNGQESKIGRAVYPRDSKAQNAEEAYLATLMKPAAEWKIYELTEKTGLIFICNPFRKLGQRYWACRCLQDYPRKPHRLNLDAHGDLGENEDWWEICQKGQKGKLLRKKLRWATMGYHHNWNTKVYSESACDPFPTDLAALSRYVARVAGFEDFSAEAAIVNYYHFDSSLSGHTDHSEVDLSAPLFSFSFGQTAIFLLGGPNLDDEPTPVYIKSGDIVIMSEYSRKCYHGVPKVLPALSAPWESDADGFSEELKRCKNTTCDHDSSLNDSVNDNTGNEQDPKHDSKRPRNNDTTDEFSHKKFKENENFQKHFSGEILNNDSFWKPFKDYIENSRINMNVRQVLPKGQEKLCADMKES